MTGERIKELKEIFCNVAQREKKMKSVEENRRNRGSMRRQKMSV